MNIENDVRKCIENLLNKNKSKFIIFPYGDIGRTVNEILTSVYNIAPHYIIDNHLCKYNSNIKPLSFLETIDCTEYVVILATTNHKIYIELKNSLVNLFPQENIAELSVVQTIDSLFTTQIGKYSFGPICKNHSLIKSIGSFCSFATGVAVVLNHDMQYITTHPMIYSGADCPTPEGPIEYSFFKYKPWYFKDVSPHNTVAKFQRITIGNDVWLGRNVIITNYANIGNGVIAGAGSIITKDVPDYAIVVGVPARIIGYRYTPEQIDALNQIQWWNWTDEEIRERYDDLYLPIDEFISKYRKTTN